MDTVPSVPFPSLGRVCTDTTTAVPAERVYDTAVLSVRVFRGSSASVTTGANLRILLPAHLHAEMLGEGHIKPPFLTNNGKELLQ